MAEAFTTFLRGKKTSQRIGLFDLVSTKSLVLLGDIHAKPFFRRLKAKVKAFGQYRGVAVFFPADGIFTGRGREGALSMGMAINCTFLHDGFPGGRARTADISPQPGEGTLKVLDLFPPSLRGN